MVRFAVRLGWGVFILCGLSILVAQWVGQTTRADEIAFRTVHGSIASIDVPHGITTTLLKPITTTSGGYTEWYVPGWSPDGTRLAVVSLDARGNQALHILDMDSHSLRTAADGLHYANEFHWSPDGTRLAYLSAQTGGYNIYIADPQGTNPRKLTDFDQQITCIDWSPDGTQIAFDLYWDGDTELYAVNVDSGAVRKLVERIGFDDTCPRWSPLGTEILFTSRVNRDFGATQLYILTLSDGTVHEFSTNQGLNLFANWSPDGNWITYVAGIEIYAQPMRGGELHDLSRNRVAYDTMPIWSPDGQEIAFISNREDSHFNNLYLVDKDGSAIRKLTHNDLDGTVPWLAWRP